MIRYENAVDKLALYLNQEMFADAERNQLADRIAKLDGPGVRFLSAVVNIAITDEETTAEEKKHITRSMSTLLDIVENDDGVLQPLHRDIMEEMLPSIEALGTEGIRRRCLYTMYYLFDGTDPGTALAFADRLETLSDGFVFFGELSLDDAFLYRKLYALTVGLYSDIMPQGRIALLLQTQFCLILFMMDAELVPMIGNHIWKYLVADTRREASLDFAAALALNHTAFGYNASKQDLEIEDWIAKIRGVLADGGDVLKVRSWLQTNKDVKANNEYIQSVIYRLVLTYTALVSGYFILEYRGEASFEAIVAQLERMRKGSLPAKKETGSFPDHLKKHEKDFAFWVREPATLEELLHWLRERGDAASARTALRTLLQKTHTQNFDDTNVVNAILQLDAFLRNNGFEGKSDLIFFNEKTGTFEWSS